MTAWLAMGGYGGFVWSGFAVSVFVLGGLLIVSLRDLHHQKTLIDTLDPGRRNDPPATTGT